MFSLTSEFHISCSLSVISANDIWSLQYSSTSGSVETRVLKAVNQPTTTTTTTKPTTTKPTTKPITTTTTTAQSSAAINKTKLAKDVSQILEMLKIISIIFSDDCHQTTKRSTRYYIVNKLHTYNSIH
jgi:hypothetical protein